MNLRLAHEIAVFCRWNHPLVLAIPFRAHNLNMVSKRHNISRLKIARSNPQKWNVVQSYIYPSVYLARSGMITDACQHLDWKMHIEIVDLPIENGDWFSSSLCKCLPEGMGPTQLHMFLIQSLSTIPLAVNQDCGLWTLPCFHSWHPRPCSRHQTHQIHPQISGMSSLYTAWLIGFLIKWWIVILPNILDSIVPEPIINQLSELSFISYIHWYPNIFMVTTSII